MPHEVASRIFDDWPTSGPGRGLVLALAVSPAAQRTAPSPTPPYDSRVNTAALGVKARRSPARTRNVRNHSGARYERPPGRSSHVAPLNEPPRPPFVLSRAIPFQSLILVFAHGVADWEERIHKAARPIFSVASARCRSTAHAACAGSLPFCSPLFERTRFLVKDLHELNDRCLDSTLDRYAIVGLPDLRSFRKDSRRQPPRSV